jgi:hypothetical protein
MPRCKAATISFVTVTAIALGAVAEAKVFTVDEAVSLSKRTGRPLFAVAGSKT